MGRSVDYHTYSELTLFIELGDDEFAWDDLRDNLRYSLEASYPAFRTDEVWPSREVLTILRSEIVDVSISSYGGLASVSFSPRTDRADFHERFGKTWIKNNAKKLTDIVSGNAGPLLRKLGTASNGESFFQRASA